MKRSDDHHCILLFFKIMLFKLLIHPFIAVIAVLVATVVQGKSDFTQLAVLNDNDSNFTNQRQMPDSYIGVYKGHNAWDGEIYLLRYLSGQKSIVQFLKANEVETIVEFGAGDAYLARKLIKEGFNVNCYDGNPETKEITSNLCSALDFSAPVNVSTHDWVLSFEVGEHIDKEFEDVFINNLFISAKKGIIISWPEPHFYTIPMHVNERPNSYIKHKFLTLGMINDLNAEEFLSKSYGPSASKIMVFLKNTTVLNQSWMEDVKGMKVPSFQLDSFCDIVDNFMQNKLSINCSAVEEPYVKSIISKSIIRSVDSFVEEIKEITGFNINNLFGSALRYFYFCHKDNTLTEMTKLTNNDVIKDFLLEHKQYLICTQNSKKLQHYNYQESSIIPVEKTFKTALEGYVNKPVAKLSDLFSYASSVSDMFKFFFVWINGYSLYQFTYKYLLQYDNHYYNKLVAEFERDPDKFFDLALKKEIGHYFKPYILSLKNSSTLISLRDEIVTLDKDIKQYAIDKSLQFQEKVTLNNAINICAGSYLFLPSLPRFLKENYEVFASHINLTHYSHVGFFTMITEPNERVTILHNDFTSLSGIITDPIKFHDADAEAINLHITLNEQNPNYPRFIYYDKVGRVQFNARYAFKKLLEANAITKEEGLQFIAAIESMKTQQYAMIALSNKFYLHTEEGKQYHHHKAEFANTKFSEGLLFYPYLYHEGLEVKDAQTDRITIVLRFFTKNMMKIVNATVKDYLHYTTSCMNSSLDVFNHLHKSQVNLQDLTELFFGKDKKYQEINFEYIELAKDEKANELKDIVTPSLRELEQFYQLYSNHSKLVSDEDEL